MNGLILAAALAAAAVQADTVAPSHEQTAAIAYLGELSNLAYIYGVCERHFPPNIPRDFVSNAVAAQKAPTALAEFAQSLWAERFTAGLADQTVKNLPREQCMIMVRVSSETLNSGPRLTP